MNTLPEIESKLSENGKKYRQLYYNLAELRKKYYKPEQSEMLDKLEEELYNEMESFFVDHNFYKGIDITQISEEESQLIEDELPQYFDFLFDDKDENKSNLQSYLNVYPICQYFIKQTSYKYNPKFPKLNKKSYFGTELKDFMGYSYCFIDIPQIDDTIERQLVMIAETDFKKINDEYMFINYAQNFPIITKKKELNDN